MLSDDRKDEIAQEERYRREVQVRLDAEAPPKTWRQQLFTTDNVKWIATTLLVPLAIFAWGLGQRTLVEGRQDVNQLTALLPSLSSADQHQHCIALTVLEELVLVEPDSKTLKGTATRIEDEVDAQQHSGDPAVSTDAARYRLCIQDGAAPPPPPPPPSAPSAGAAVSTASPPPPLASFPPSTTVYLQIYGEAQRAEAKALQTALEGAGIPVRSIDDIAVDHGPGQIPYPQTGAVDIRFYKAADRTTALALVPLVQKVTTHGKPTVRDLTSRGDATRPGTIEIWFPCATPCVGAAG